MNIPGSGHTVKKFDEELATLRDLVLRMGGLVEEQLRRALQVLARVDADGAREVVKGDLQIDRIELQADREVAQLLARRTPLGVDLRTVLMLSKSVTDIERIGDEAKKIARTCRKVPGERSAMLALPYMDAIAALGELAIRQLAGALDVLARLDVERAEAVRRGDDELDDRCDALLAAITGHMLAQPASIPFAVPLLFAAKALERIGDHTKNISQYVVYLVEGRDVRHRKAVKAAQQAD
jgi:phosphate transport system protein